MSDRTLLSEGSRGVKRARGEAETSSLFKYRNAAKVEGLRAVQGASMLSRPQAAPKSVDENKMLDSVYAQCISVLRTMSRLNTDSISHTRDGSDVQIEIEARLGVLTHQKFDSTITSEHYDRIRKTLESRKDFEPLGDEDHIDYSYANTSDDATANLPNQLKNKRRARFTAGTLESAITKRRLDVPIDVSMVPFTYDMRMGIAAETEWSSYKTDDDEPLDGWTGARRKSRTSYAHVRTDGQVPVKTAMSLWQIDLTRVETLKEDSNAKDKDPMYEVEIELGHEALAVCMPELAVTMGLDPKDYEEDFGGITIEVLAQALVSIVKIINPRLVGSSQANDEFMEMVPRSPVPPDVHIAVNKLIATIVQPLRSQLHSSQPIKQFPGSLPVALSRRHFRRLESKHYWVSEKTDGLRFMLLVVSRPIDPIPVGMYIVDRKFSILRLGDQCNLLATLFANEKANEQGGVSLVDGEFVFNLTQKRPMFLMFDILQWGGQFVGNLPLHERVACLHSIIVQYYKLHNSASTDIARVPILVGVKSFKHMSEMKDLIERIHTSKDENNNLERIYRDRSRQGEPLRPGYRHHKTDGLILTPLNEPYKLRGVQTLFKWKYQDLTSVDFVVRPKPQNGDSENFFALLAGGPNSLIEMRVVELLEEDARRIRECKRHYEREQRRFAGGDKGLCPLPHEPIAEMVFDASSGYWKLETFRPDKRKPNFSTVVMDTMEALAENIQIDDLRRLKVPKPNRPEV